MNVPQTLERTGCPIKVLPGIIMSDIVDGRRGHLTRARDLARATAQIEREALGLLRRLARRGTFGVVVEGGTAFALRHDGDAPSTGPGHWPHAVFLYAQQQGWLFIDGTEGGWKLSSHGAVALKAARASKGLPDELPLKRDRVAAGQRIERNAPSDGDVASASAPAKRTKVARGEPASPLDWLRKRKGRDGSALIDEAQFTAGERLRTDYLLGQQGPRITSRWGPPTAEMPRRRTGGLGDGLGGGLGLSERAMAAQARVTLALESMAPELAQVLVDVCCLERGLERVERGAQWPARTGKIVLGIALNALARHYGLTNIDNDGHRGGRGDHVDRALNPTPKR
ncbi:MAG: DUF6456 domain-containing protein [Pseudomonadota bacterium]